MRSITKRCWLSFVPLRSGDTSLKVQGIVSKCGLTTRTWNTSEQCEVYLRYFYQKPAHSSLYADGL